LSVNAHLKTTAAGQPEATTADPGTAVIVKIDPSSCAAGGVYHAPTGHALIITGVNFYGYAIKAGQNHELDLYAGASVSPCFHPLTVGASDQNQLTLHQDFNPGIPVPAGDVFGTKSTNDEGEIEIYGYLVPASDVPANALAHALI
jgi:hypothetical protein